MILAKKFLALPQVTYCYRCGHQTDPRKWPVTKLNDTINGWIDVLNLSRTHQLATMHSVAVEHVEDPYTFDAVMQEMYKNDSKVLQLLVKVNATIDTALLQQVRPELSEEQQYVIKEFREALHNHSILNDKYCHLQCDFEQMSHSFSFNIGRVFTWGPRKVRDLMKKVKA